MQPEQRLVRNIKAVLGPAPLGFYQGIVKAVDGLTCTVTFGSQDVSGIRLRASLTERGGQMLVTPKVGSAVVVGSLSGDLSDLVVVLVDEVETIEVGGGKLGGLINIEALTEKLNALVEAFNGHTHIVPPGGVIVGTLTNAAPVNVPQILAPAANFSRRDYEDDTVKH